VAKYAIAYSDFVVWENCATKSCRKIASMTAVLVFVVATLVHSENYASPQSDWCRKVCMQGVPVVNNTLGKIYYLSNWNRFCR